jgi:nucleotide-binding universal stress UspA family protein
MKNILVAIDFSDGARAAADYAMALAERLGAALVALHVTPRYVTYEPLPAFPVPAPLDPERQERIRGDIRRFVAPSGSGHALGEALVREGDPADEILAAAASVDLIVLGGHGHRSFERWLLGSVADRVARKCDRPVLIVPSVPARPNRFAHVLCAVDFSSSSAATLTYAGEIAKTLHAGLIALHVTDELQWYEPGPSAGVDVEAVRRAAEVSARQRLDALAAASGRSNASPRKGPTWQCWESAPAAASTDSSSARPPSTSSARVCVRCFSCGNSRTSRVAALEMLSEEPHDPLFQP